MDIKLYYVLTLTYKMALCILNSFNRLKKQTTQNRPDSKLFGIKVWKLHNHFRFYGIKSLATVQFRYAFFALLATIPIPCSMSNIWGQWGFVLTYYFLADIPDKLALFKSGGRQNIGLNCPHLILKWSDGSGMKLDCIPRPKGTNESWCPRPHKYRSAGTYWDIGNVPH